jgi:hypothetical protein
MSHGPQLLAGERVVWAGVHGQPSQLPGGAMGCRIAYAWTLLFMLGAMSIVPLMVFPEARIFALLVVVVIVAGVIAWRSYRKRPAIFVTDQRIVERSLFGNTSVGIAEVRGYYRRVDKYRDRYGNVTEVATNYVVLVSHAGGQRSIGPVLDYDALTGLLDGLISRDIDPSKMRGLGGSPPAAAESREDIFVAVDNRTEGDAYGPLVIGPRGLVRFTEKLPIALEGQLLTALARPETPEDLEAKVVFLTRRPDAGHALIVDLSSAELGMDSTTLRLKLKDRTVHIQLGDADAMRARKFLQARR